MTGIAPIVSDSFSNDWIALSRNDTPPLITSLFVMDATKESKLLEREFKRPSHESAVLFASSSAEPVPCENSPTIFSYKSHRESKALSALAWYFPPMSEISPCFSALLSGKELYTSAKSFNISIGLRSVATPSLIYSNSTPREWHLSSTFLSCSSSITSPSNSPEICWRLRIMERKERPISEPLLFVAATMAASAAVSSSMATPALAAKDADTRVASAISVNDALFLFEM